MPDVDLKYLTAYHNPGEAAIIQSRLENSGIRCYIEGGLTGVTLSGMLSNATGGVKILVESRHLTVARQLYREALAELEQLRNAPVQPWQCPECSEPVEGNFDLCWNCGTVRPDLAELPPYVSETLTICPMCGEEQPDSNWQCAKCGEEFHA